MLLFTAMDKDHKFYEIGYIINPAYSEEEAANFHNGIKQEIQKNGGFIENEGTIFKRRLSYPIKKMTEGLFASMQFTLDPAKLEEIKSKFGSKEILRSIIFKTKKAPARVMKTRIFKPAQTVSEMSGEKTIPTQMEPASNIEEIDKKLEEILGK